MQSQTTAFEINGNNNFLQVLATCLANISTLSLGRFELFVQRGSLNHKPLNQSDSYEMKNVSELLLLVAILDFSEGIV